MRYKLCKFFINTLYPILLSLPLLNVCVMRKIIFSLIYCIAAVLFVAARQPVRIDMAAAKKSVVRQPVGVNLFMLMDHDEAQYRARPMWKALRDMGVRSVRFNEGEYGDWYMFTHPDSVYLLTSPGAKLYPHLIDIKSRGIDGKLTDIGAEPHYGGYPLNQPGYRRTTDFNDFITLCRKAGADDPTIIIPTLPVDWENAKSFYPTRADMVKLAAAMVRYANGVCRCGFRFWEIGNEHYWEHNNDPYDTAWAAQCASLILEMARAMKAEDPAIEIGINGFTSPWLETLLTYSDTNGRLIDYVDNIIPHQYAKPERIGNYELYKKAEAYRLHEVDEVVGFLARRDVPDTAKRGKMKIEVTEASSFMPGKKALHVDNVAWISLANFEHLGSILAAPKVEYVHFWVTHWTDDSTYWSALKMDNRLAPMGWAVKLWNDHLLSTLWKADLRSPSVHCYASADSTGQKLVLFLVNRLENEQECPIELTRYSGKPAYRVSGIWATHPDYRDFRPLPPSRGVAGNGSFTLCLRPLSVTVVRFDE